MSVKPLCRPGSRPLVLPARCRYAAMTGFVDDAIHNMTSLLKAKGACGVVHTLALSCA